MRELVGSKNTIGQNGLSVEKAPKSDLYLYLKPKSAVALLEFLISVFSAGDNCKKPTLPCKYFIMIFFRFNLKLQQLKIIKKITW